MKQTQTPESKSVRLLKVGEQVRHVLAQVLQRGEVSDHELNDMIVSVSEVRVSPDLRHAAVYVKELGGRDEDMLVALKRATKFLRGQVARALSTKYTPELKFRLDESYAEAAKIDALLRSEKVAKDLASDEEE
ncbi:30S ribosome-binding factor RbfA [Pacificimonas sp. WHA3]|uniref:Ribosome-binding factor A n=1 Tax=Pacificimonas pallii TaxID=2827236 RepID=A0ABS6SC01_9SPHN|nr:30S ribosome-binding factor RbfA [Pacificimonas pallii]MBV7255952.1 30S ribosome-binding factor RbfA [Pacificimonas pallii]